MLACGWLLMVGMYVVLNQNRSKQLRSSRYGSKLLTTKHKSIAGFDCLLAASGEVLFIVHSNTSIQTSFLRLFTMPSPSPAITHHPSSPITHSSSITEGTVKSGQINTFTASSFS